MNDWASFMLLLEDHRKAVDLTLTNYPPAQPIDAATALKIEGHLDAMVGCLNQIDAWVANHCE